MTVAVAIGDPPPPSFLRREPKLTMQDPPSVTIEILPTNRGHGMPFLTGGKPADFAPLIERAPELTARAIRQAFDDAAREVEITADAEMQRAIELVAEAKETAAELRAMGDRHAAAVQSVAEIARDVAAGLKAQRARIKAEPNGGGA